MTYSKASWLLPLPTPPRMISGLETQKKVAPPGEKRQASEKGDKLEVLFCMGPKENLSAWTVSTGAMASAGPPSSEAHTKYFTDGH